MKNSFPLVIAGLLFAAPALAQGTAGNTPNTGLRARAISSLASLQVKARGTLPGDPASGMRATPGLRVRERATSAGSRPTKGNEPAAAIVCDAKVALREAPAPRDALGPLSNWERESRA
jgi:hypothetical protein